MGLGAVVVLAIGGLLTVYEEAITLYAKEAETVYEKGVVTKNLGGANGDETASVRAAAIELN